MIKNINHYLTLSRWDNMLVENEISLSLGVASSRRRVNRHKERGYLVLFRYNTFKSLTSINNNGSMIFLDCENIFYSPATYRN
jgi:hypothetical protein